MLSDLASQIISKMIGGNGSQLEVAAAQSLWVHTISAGVTGLRSTMAEANVKTMQTVSDMVANNWANDDPMLLKMVENSNKCDEAITKLLLRMVDMQQPRSGGLFA